MKKVIILFITIITFSFSFAQSNDYNKGIEELKKENYNIALQYFNADIEKNPHGGYSYVWKAYINIQNKVYSDVFESADLAIKYLPKNEKKFLALAFSFKGVASKEIGDTIQALKYYEKAMKLNPEEISFVTEHCDLLYFSKLHELEKNDIKKMHEISPNSPIALAYEGRNNYALGNIDYAIECYSKGIKLNSNYASNYSFRAEAYMATGNYNNASKDIISALIINKDNKAFGLLDQIAEKSYANISTKLLAQRKKDPKEPYWPYCLGHICIATQKYCDAISYLKQALKIGGYDNLVYRRIAEAYCEIGNYELSIDFYNRSFSENEDNIISLYSCAYTYLKSGNKEKALEKANDLIDNYPENPICYDLRGYIQLMSGNFNEAVEDFSTYIELNGDNAQTYHYRGTAYAMMNMKGKAIIDFEKSINTLEKKKIYGKDEKTLYTFANCWLYKLTKDNKRKNQALEWFSVAFNDSEEDNGDCYNIACVYSLLGESQKSIEWLKKAIDNGYHDFNHARKDYDLDNIRDISDFNSIIDEAEKSWKNKYDCNEEIIDDAIKGEDDSPQILEKNMYKI